MLYHLINWLKTHFDVSGAGLFQSITFRVAMAVILSLIVSMLFGKRIIHFLRTLQIGETVRDLGLAGEQTKKGTPTMGGFIILLAMIVPTLLFANLTNVYIILILSVAIWCGAIGFIDDLLKIRAKKKALADGKKYAKADADGLRGKFKIAGQVGIGLIVGTTLYFNQYVTVQREIYPANGITAKEQVQNKGEQYMSDTLQKIGGVNHLFVKVKTPITTIPFVKGHEFNYSRLLPGGLKSFTWVLYVLVVIFIITAVSNGANITDGLDGLATGTSSIIGIGLGLFAYVSGNIRFAEYLNIMYIHYITCIVIY